MFESLHRGAQLCKTARRLRRAAGNGHTVHFDGRNGSRFHWLCLGLRHQGAVNRHLANRLVRATGDLPLKGRFHIPESHGVTLCPHGAKNNLALLLSKILWG